MNIRQVRKKIKSVTNVRKITSAMQLVSSIKMRKSQAIAYEGKPYQEILEEAIKKAIKKINPHSSQLLTQKKHAHKKELVILLTSNKGLCGAFNINLVRFLSQRVSIADTDFITIGKKGSVLVSQLGGSVIADFSSTDPWINISAVFTLATNAFIEGKYQRILLYHNRFISTLRQDPTEETLLPLKLVLEEEDIREYGEPYEIEPDPQDIIDILLRDYLEEKIRFALIENEAGEHSARMIAMKYATDNANEVLYSLTLLRNKLRQQKITYELLDMITAKETVENL